MDHETRIDKIQQAAEALHARLKKFNSCHSKADGQFCSGSGGGVKSKLTLNDAKMLRDIVAHFHKAKEEYAIPGGKAEMKRARKLEGLGLIEIRSGPLVQGRKFKSYNWSQHWKMEPTEYRNYYATPAKGWRDKLQ